MLKDLAREFHMSAIAVCVVHPGSVCTWINILERGYSCKLTPLFPIE